MRGLFGHAGTLAVLALLLVAGGARAEVPLPKIPKAKGEQCVEPTDVMRREHMNFLFHQRDDTLRRGIRTKKYSLRECLDCHVTAEPGKPLPTADSPDHFCTACHRYAAVKIDCFGCHSDRPDPSSRPLAGAPGGWPDSPVARRLDVETLKVLATGEEAR